MIMATRAEKFRAAQERHPTERAEKKARVHETKKSRVKRALHAHPNARAGRKATVALEPRPAKGRPSRKSTRASANRGRSDVAVSELRAERWHSSPKARAAEYRNRK